MSDKTLKRMPLITQCRTANTTTKIRTVMIVSPSIVRPPVQELHLAAMERLEHDLNKNEKNATRALRERLTAARAAREATCVRCALSRVYGNRVVCHGGKGLNIPSCFGREWTRHTVVGRWEHGVLKTQGVDCMLDWPQTVLCLVTMFDCCRRCLHYRVR